MIIFHPVDLSLLLPSCEFRGTMAEVKKSPKSDKSGLHLTFTFYLLAPRIFCHKTLARGVSYPKGKSRHSCRCALDYQSLSLRNGRIE